MALVNTLGSVRQGVLDWLIASRFSSQMETLEIVLDPDQMDMILASMAQVRRCEPGDLVSVADAFADLASDHSGS